MMIFQSSTCQLRTGLDSSVASFPVWTAELLPFLSTLLHYFIISASFPCHHTDMILLPILLSFSLPLAIRTVTLPLHMLSLSLSRTVVSGFSQI
jgi:hypothetical protein